MPINTRLQFCCDISFECDISSAREMIEQAIEQLQDALAELPEEQLEPVEQVWSEIGLGDYRLTFQGDEIISCEHRAHAGEHWRAIALADVPGYGEPPEMKSVEVKNDSKLKEWSFKL